MIEAAARSAQFILAIGIAYLVALWFALVAWTFRDIESRSRSVFTQVFSTLLVVLFFVPGLLIYLILRPKESLDQAFQRALEEEYLLQDLDDLPLCPSCQRTVDSEFVLCPHCQTRLRGPCPSCSRLIDLRWSVCPYCAVPVESQTLESAASFETLPLPDTAREGRRRRAVAAAAQRVGIGADELDAFTDAMADPGDRKAVDAGSAFARRISAIGESSSSISNVRAKLSRIAASPTVAPERDRDAWPGVVENGISRNTEEGFWSEPLPTSEKDRDGSSS